MAGIGSWFRSISSVSNSLSRFGKVAVDAQLNTTRSKFAFVNSGLALSGSILRLGTKVVDYTASRITGRPVKKRSPKRKKSNSRGNSTKGSRNSLDNPAFANSKKGKAAQQKEYRKEDLASKQRLKDQGIDENEKPMSFLEEDRESNDFVAMPKFEVTPEEREAMEKLAQFNASNRGYDSDGVATSNASDDKMKTLFDYLATTEYFRESVAYTEDEKAIVVTLKPLAIQTNDEFFVNFKELILSPTAIMNPEYENYLQMANVNPSKLMTSLLQDYHVERAPMLYFVINYYMKSNAK